MSIKIETSRAQLTAGTGLGVVAEIRNRSDATIYIQEKSVTMKIPAELEGPFSRGGSWWAFFPTEQHEGKPDVSDNTIALPSGDAYKVFWTRPLTEVAQKEASSLLDMVLGDAKSILYSIAAELNFTFFQPGDYTIAVVAKYWTDPKDVGHERYRTLTQSATFHFATPQFVVLLGAAFGGLSAYVIFPETRRRLALKRSERGAASSAREFLERVTTIGGAVLLARITTILLSRVAETQFLILLFESLSTTSGVRWRLVSPRPIWARAISSRTFSQSPTSRTQERRPPPRPLPPRRQQLLRPRSHRYQRPPVTQAATPVPIRHSRRNTRRFTPVS